MRVAQNLYEQGYITYMRTDSVHLSQQAIAAARSCVRNQVRHRVTSVPSPDSTPPKPRALKRPTKLSAPPVVPSAPPSETGLSGREAALYDLIWKRTVATQMAEARQTHITVLVEVDNAVFRASGQAD